MNVRIEKLQQRVRDGLHRSLRKQESISIIEECEAENLSWPRRAARLTRRQCEAETPILLPDERIVFTRTLPATIPPMYSETDWQRITAGHTLHELGPINNICADWGKTLSQGLLGRRETALTGRERYKNDTTAVEFLNCAIETIDAVLELTGRYASAADWIGRSDVAEILAKVPAHPPSNFHEALQSLRILHSVVWLSGHYHVGLGRLDMYLWPYLKADLDSGLLDIADAEELLAEFFISLNKDSDLYPGVQQGDNGQTITLGGVDRQGNVVDNELTRMALRVSRDLAMIDPKVNLRITARTDLDLLCLATELTRKGLGFPQYSNDDVVIPALLAHGYSVEDARDYAVAACWEFLVPGRGMEIVNIGAVSMPAAVDHGIRHGLAAGEDFEGVFRLVASDIRKQTHQLVDAYKKLLLPPAPYYSVLMSDCLERGKDICEGATYNNHGIHGAGSANAADALAAIKKFIFDEKSLSARDLLNALDTNYEGAEALRARLADDGPKIGRNDDPPDHLMVRLFDAFAEACDLEKDNGRGGLIRPGTGSAMYYVWLARGHDGMREPVVGATAEGRRAGDFFSANLSPSPGVLVNGPLSILQTYAKIDYLRIFNGGPITVELSDTVFRDPESIRKVAMLVRTFAQLGCQQVQLNSLNAEILLDAKAHPERHKNLIVRVWGWSGYFCELSPEYQDHIIQRALYQQTT
jgi:pyruvate-formate lyase